MKKKIEFEKIGDQLFEDLKDKKINNLNEIKGGLLQSLPMTIMTVGGDERFEDYQYSIEILNNYQAYYFLLRLVHLTI